MDDVANPQLGYEEKRRMLAEMARQIVPEETKLEVRIRLDTLRLRAIEMDNKMTSEAPEERDDKGARLSPEEELAECLRSPLFRHAFLAQKGVREAMQEFLEGA